MVSDEVWNRLEPVIDLFESDCRNQLQKTPNNHEAICRLSGKLRGDWLKKLESLLIRVEPSLAEGAGALLANSDRPVDQRALWTAVPHYQNMLGSPPGAFDTVGKRGAGGAATGAVLGSVVPVIGTAAGAMVGGLCGFALGAGKHEDLIRKWHESAQAQHSGYADQFFAKVRAALKEA